MGTITTCTRLKHADDIYFHRRSGQQPHKGRGNDGGQQRGNSRHRHTERHITLGQITDDVAGRTSRTTTYKDDSQCKLLRQRQQFAEQPCQRGHDEELRQLAHQNIFGMLQNRSEVGRTERQSHTNITMPEILV